MEALDIVAPVDRDRPPPRIQSEREREDFSVELDRVGSASIRRGDDSATGDAGGGDGHVNRASAQASPTPASAPANAPSTDAATQAVTDQLDIPSGIVALVPPKPILIETVGLLSDAPVPVPVSVPITRPPVPAAPALGGAATAASALLAALSAGSERTAPAAGAAPANAGASGQASTIVLAGSAKPATPIPATPNPAAVIPVVLATMPATAGAPGIALAAAEVGTTAVSSPAPLAPIAEVRATAPQVPVRQRSALSLRGARPHDPLTTDLAVASQLGRAAAPGQTGTAANTLGQPGADGNGNGSSNGDGRGRGLALGLAVASAVGAKTAVPAHVNLPEASQFSTLLPAASDALAATSPTLSAAAPGTLSAAAGTAAGVAPRAAVMVPPAMQVAVQIARAAEEGINRISMRLHPADMGRVDVELEVRSDGRVMAVVAADKQETLEMLQRDSRSLEKALQDAGLRTGSDSLSFSLREHKDGESDPGQGSSGTAAELAENESDPAIVPPHAQPRSVPALDIRV